METITFAQVEPALHHLRGDKVPRRVFFSFDYENDLSRARQVRDLWVSSESEAVGVWDQAEWQNVLRRGHDAVKRWINQHLAGTSVTVVLIGSDTAARSYVQYEILRSYELGKGLVGVRIHGMKDSHGKTDVFGANPLDSIHTFRGSAKIHFSDIYANYDWSLDDGPANLKTWIERAAKAAGR